MALHRFTLEIVANTMRVLNKDSFTRRRAMMFSYHDVICALPVVEAIFGRRTHGQVCLREDAAQIVAWHNSADIDTRVVDTVHLFELVGWKLDVLDKVQARGVEQYADLCEPLDPSLHERYDLVYDGVIGQVFLSGQCMANACNLVRCGGYLISVAVANGPNHGFYSLSPTFYTDFLGQNGFAVKKHVVVADIVRKPEPVEFHPTAGCILPHGCVQVVVARRMQVQKLVWPTQSKFAKHPMSLK